MRLLFLVALVASAPSPQQASKDDLGGAERYLAHVSTDKPIYKAGETIYARAVVLETHSHKPWLSPLMAQAVLKGPKGDIVAQGQAQGADGAVSFAWPVPDGIAGGS